MRELGGTVWISRVPETLGSAREILLAVAGDLMRTEEESACRAVGVVYAGIRQRWLVVFSREARQRAEKTLQRQHLRQGEAELKAFDTLCRQGFACETDAQAALDAFTKALKLTAVAEGRVAARTRHAKKGRPAKGQEPGVVSYAIKGQLASRLDIHAPVSYTHLDVYKRQCPALSMHEQPNLQGHASRPSTFCPTSPYQ